MRVIITVQVLYLDGHSEEQNYNVPKRRSVKSAFETLVKAFTHGYENKVKNLRVVGMRTLMGGAGFYEWVNPKYKHLIDPFSRRLYSFN